MKCLKLLVCGYLLVVAGSCSYTTNGVKIVFRNESSETLTSVQLRYKGGEHTETNLPPHAVVYTTVDPTDESSIEVVVTFEKQTLSKNLYEYIEPGYRGKIVVTFGKDHKIKHKASMMLGGLSEASPKPGAPGSNLQTTNSDLR